ncbi:MAG: serine hydrolase [Alphaproteobacteria bacterium]|nr:serine hydrolase [Alphaproteobacteria bacterium]
MRVAAIVVGFVLAATLADAADAPAYLVAGYKALFSCSATFLAHRTPEQIKEFELTGIYRDYEPVMEKLPPSQVDMKAGTVSVTYDAGQPARIAKFNGRLGCVLLPPMAAGTIALPRVALPTAPDRTNEAWPMGDVLPQAPMTGDLNGKPLARTIARAFDGQTYGAGARTSAVIIVKDDAIVAEKYALGTDIDVPQRTWSVAKSIMGVLIGIAARDGLLKADQPAELKAWAAPGDPRATIRIVDLMRMSSGLEAGPAGNRTDDVYFGGGRVIDHALTHDLVAMPNTRWFYANDDALALSYLLRTRLHNDKTYLAYPYEKLFRRIGMMHTTAETDWDGTFILSSQVWTTARDLARFGMLLVNDGVWQGQRILPEDWVKLMATPAPMQPPEKRHDGSDLPGYGGDVWLFGPRHGLPEGTFAAMGNRGQYVVVVPSRKVVIVRRGFDGDGVRFAIDKFSADMLKALQ